MKKTSEQEYRDVIRLPHFKSKKHPHMSMNDRAAQFAPFAALTGFGTVIAHTAEQSEKTFEQSDTMETKRNEHEHTKT